MKPIETDEEYEAALKEVEPYFDSEPERESPACHLMDALVKRIEEYEAKHFNGE